MIGFQPAARVGDMAVCAGPPDAIAKGSLTVMIDFMPAARLGDLTTHGGTITVGCPTVFIGDQGGGPAAAIGAFQAAADNGTALVCRGACAACGHM